jgi:hypothetical protein
MEDTNKIALYETVNQFICALNGHPDYDSLPRSFAYPKEIPQKSILFFGLQPPMSETIGHTLKIYNQERDRDETSYFDQFQEIAEYCNTPWAHLNLLYFRNTKYTGIDELLNTEAGVWFIREQLKNTDEFLRQIKPEIIVVNNTDACKFLGFNKTVQKDVWLDYEFVFDNAIGTYSWNGTPVFFTNLFKGQRTFNKGSFERLKWHIRHTLIIDLEKKKKEVVAFKNEVVKSQKYDLAEELREQERELEERLVGLRFNY